MLRRLHRSHKIVATRGSYDDKALESRFLTEEMGSRKLRPDIPINLPDSFKEEARDLRNKLLLYRFHRRHEVKLDESLVDPTSRGSIKYSCRS